MSFFMSYGLLGSSGIRVSRLGSSRSDGSVVAWGWNFENQCHVPEPNARFVALSAGGALSVALQQDYTPVESPGAPIQRPGGIRIRGLAPNPFNPSTRITFETRLAGMATLTIYDVTGRKVGEENLGLLPAGTHQTRWSGRFANGREAASGLYLFRLESASGESATIKGLLLR